MDTPKSLIWFTRDLRIQDNLLVEWADKVGAEIMGVVFEPRGRSVFQLRFFYQSVHDLKKQLSRRGISLLLVRGEPAEFVSQLVQANQVREVLTTRPYNARDQEVLDQVRRTSTNCLVKTFDQRTLISDSDLPFALHDLPKVFTTFRKKVEDTWRVVSPVDSSLKNLKGFEPYIPHVGEILSVEELLNSEVQLPYSFIGGETGAWNRVEEYFYKTRSPSHYKETRNGMIHKNDSSKFSPWLANGSISARSLYSEIKRYESAVGSNESTYWLVFELLWRDYFKFLSRLCGAKIFTSQGLSESPKSWVQDERLFQLWRNGETGIDFVDASMRELSQTGWISNRGRQNVASHLSKYMNVDWTWGARYFEEQLIDEDPESNWGNWMYLAGVGTDPRDRIFNIQRQAETYDPDGSYRRTWLS